MHHPTRRLAPAFAIVALFGLVGCTTVFKRTIAVTPTRTILAESRVVLPTWKGAKGHLHVDVKINGAGPFRLNIDSGCGMLMLTQRAANAAGIRAMDKAEGTYTNAAGGRNPLSFGWVDRLECGGMWLEGIYAGIVPDGTTEGFEPEMTVDGALGINAFAHVVLEVGVGSGQVAVSRSGSRTFDAERAVDCGRGIPIVIADVEGRPMRFLVDTGSDTAFEVPSLDGLPLAGRTTKWSGAYGVAGKFNAARPKLAQLAGEIRLAGVEWQNPPLSTTPRDRGRIGLGALQAWTVVFDQPVGKMYLLGETPSWVWERLAEPPGGAVGVFMVINGLKARVVEVDFGGAAERAGLRAGDVILEMDGKPGVARGFMTKSTRLRVQRGETEFETTLQSSGLVDAEARN